MAVTPPMGEHAERQLRAEMADWTQDRLLAAIAKSPGFAAGIAAQQVLAERRSREHEEKHKELLSEIRRPHWSVTPSFILLVVSVVISLAALGVALSTLPQVQRLLTELAPAEPVASGSQQAPIRLPPEPGAPQGATAPSAPASLRQK